MPSSQIAKDALESERNRLRSAISMNDRQNELFAAMAQGYADRAELLRAELVKLEEDIEWFNA